MGHGQGGKSKQRSYAPPPRRAQVDPNAGPTITEKIAARKNGGAESWDDFKAKIKEKQMAQHQAENYDTVLAAQHREVLDREREARLQAGRGALEPAAKRHKSKHKKEKKEKKESKHKKHKKKHKRDSGGPVKLSEFLAAASSNDSDSDSGAAAGGGGDGAAASSAVASASAAAASSSSAPPPPDARGQEPRRTYVPPSLRAEALQRRGGGATPAPPPAPAHAASASGASASAAASPAAAAPAAAASVAAPAAPAAPAAGERTFDVRRVGTESFGLGCEPGSDALLVREVEAGSAAEKAGIRRGHRLLRLRDLEGKLPAGAPGAEVALSSSTMATCVELMRHSGFCRVVVVES